MQVGNEYNWPERSLSYACRAFDNLQKKSNSGGFSVISKEDINISVANKKLSLVLNDDNIDNYAKASYVIFQKVGPNYSPVYTSDTFELAKNNYSMDLNMNLVKVNNPGEFIGQ